MAKKSASAITNAVRLLRAADISFETVEYPVDEEHLDARHVADALGEDITRVYKTIVLCGARVGHFVCVVPGAAEIDLKKAAAAIGDKKVELIPMRELLPLTGYIRGGCSPVGMKKHFPTIFDASAVGRGTIFVSAGRRGLQLAIDADTLMNFCNATSANITA